MVLRVKLCTQSWFPTIILLDRGSRFFLTIILLDIRRLFLRVGFFQEYIESLGQHILYQSVSPLVGGKNRTKVIDPGLEQIHSAKDQVDGVPRRFCQQNVCQDHSRLANAAVGPNKDLMASGKASLQSSSGLLAGKCILLVEIPHLFLGHRRYGFGLRFSGKQTGVLNRKGGFESLTAPKSIQVIGPVLDGQLVQLTVLVRKEALSQGEQQGIHTVFEESKRKAVVGGAVTAASS